MRELLVNPPAPADLDALAIDQLEAARLTSLSAKTLGRLADAGEPVGRVKIGRRVLYHRATLSAWLSARAGSSQLASNPDSPPSRNGAKEVGDA